jgi:sphingomyelin phosphodiesterase 2
MFSKLHAEYDRENDEYMAHRVTQAFDTAQFIKMTSRHADLVIVGGDLNTEPGDLAYKVIINTAELKDSVYDLDKSCPVS